MKRQNPKPATPSTVVYALLPVFAKSERDPSATADNHRPLRLTEMLRLTDFLCLTDLWPSPITVPHRQLHTRTRYIKTQAILKRKSVQFFKE
jgi:hypothetical protein